MRALMVERLAPDYAGCVLKAAPTPEPGPGEVRVRVRAAAVNFPDLLMTRGEYQHKPALPFVGGLEMAGEVDAVWMGDASGFGEDHFDLVAPGLRKGLPTFCDKPIGGSVAGTRKILEFARRHQAPLMSS
ncbi:MAG TPA: alcohol dehydrogenase catalytic domain-containing protein, partial [Caulobacteraceae bacterium]